MVTGPDSAGQVAPARLEPVRTLLNSWLIPNDSRRPADEFGQLARDQRWHGQAARVVGELRDDLRQAVETGDTSGLNEWIARLDLRLAVEDGKLAYRHHGGPAGDLLTAVVGAISDGSWRRLKACPDCHWVFYDNTRNGSKRWCLMYAGGPEGRACGTIAKVRRYRDRQAAAAGG